MWTGNSEVVMWDLLRHERLQEFLVVSKHAREIARQL